jgi:Flp pilus assembly protein TadG
MVLRPVDRRGMLGQSLVEFAVVVPILVLVLGGIVDLGRAFYYEVGATDAARNGARVLVGNAQGSGPALSAVCTAIKQDLANEGGVAACTQVTHAPPYTSGSDYTPPGSGKAIALVYCGNYSTDCVSAPRPGCASQVACPNQVAVYVYYGFPILLNVIQSLAGGTTIQIQAGARMVSAW